MESIFGDSEVGDVVGSTNVVTTSSAIALLAAVLLGAQVVIVDYAMTLAKRRGDDQLALGAAFFTLVSSASFLWVVVALRGGNFGTGFPSQVSVVHVLPFVVAGIADPALTRFLYYEGIDRVGPSISSAITAGSPAVAALLAIPVLGEQLPPIGALGLLLVIVGIAGLQFGRSAPSPSVGVGTLRNSVSGERPLDLLFPVGAMVLIGAAFVVTKIGLGSFPDALVATAITQTAALAAFLVVLGVSPATRVRVAVDDRRVLAVLLVAGVVLAMGWFAMFSALALGSVVTVLPLVSLYPLVVVVLTSILSRHAPVSPRVLLAVVTILVGAVLVQTT